jgi:excisionase family DNA binding protein
LTVLAKARIKVAERRAVIETSLKPGAAPRPISEFFAKEDSTLENETTITKLVFSRKEAAAYLGIHCNTLDRSAIPRIRIGRRILFKRETLEKLLTEVEPDRRGRGCRK